jgi:16S rRNA (adenine1518-N6/adenine1519-N6)-dimethyltransferase
MEAYTRLVKPNAPEAKKRFGQHFLRDTGVLDRIVRWIGPGPGDLFLEIGAGTGALSRLLAGHAERLWAVELDRDCIPLLEDALAPFPGASVIGADILKYDFGLLPAPGPGQKLRVAGNLPYNIATATIGRLFDSRLEPADMFFMLQLEVAQRIAAPPGSRLYGYLSVRCQYHAEVRMGFRVSPSCFVPRPAVSSAMIALTPRAGRRGPGWEAHFDLLCKGAFAHRRKTLGNSLSLHPQLGKIAPALLEAAGIDGRRRAEDLSVDEYVRLTSAFHDHFVPYAPPADPGV